MLIRLRTIVLVFVALGVLGGAVGVWLVQSGFYDVAATQPHTVLSYHLLHHVMRRSVKARAGGIEVPATLDDPTHIARGDALYRTHCLQCHGGPGVAPDPLGLGMRPLPTNLALAGREWPPAELYWVIRHGVRMSAMPGWKYRLRDDQLWDLTAFVKQLPRITPLAFRTAAPAGPAPPEVAAADGKAAAWARVPDADRGQHLMSQYMCATCHVIPGVPDADQTVGPPLEGIAGRTFIAGVLSNTPENMVRWLRDPQQVDPLTAMPDLRIGEADARDLAAYLYTLQADGAGR